MRISASWQWRRLLPAGSVPRSFLVWLAVLATSPAALAEDYFFKTPSGNIYCAYDDYDGMPQVRCDIRNYTPTGSKRPADCDLEWGDSLAVTADSSEGAMICHGDTVISPDARELPYGSTYANGGISCTSERTGLTCKNGKGHGFSLSRARQTVF